VNIAHYRSHHAETIEIGRSFVKFGGDALYAVLYVTAVLGWGGGTASCQPVKTAYGNRIDVGTDDELICRNQLVPAPLL